LRKFSGTSISNLLHQPIPPDKVTPSSIMTTVKAKVGGNHVEVDVAVGNIRGFVF
jgi:hypothetical protein